MPTMIETVSEIALSQPSAIRVFEQFGIDYCCGGRKPLAVACTEREIDLDLLLNALASAAAEPAPQATDWSTASLAKLSAHIVASHHEYLKSELPRLHSLAAKVVERHAANHPELSAIQSILQSLGSELTQHMMKEEMVLFPYIQKLEHAASHGGQRPQSCFGAIANPIAMMTQEHDSAGELLAELRQLSNQYGAPEGACPTYHAFFDGLRDMEQDLHQHIHLENNILFPRAIELEAAQR